MLELGSLSEAPFPISKLSVRAIELGNTLQLRVLEILDLNLICVRVCVCVSDAREQAMQLAYGISTY